VLQKLAKKLGHNTRGFRVTRVYPGTEADKAGLRVGDIITGLDDQKLSPVGMQDAGLFARRVRMLDTDGRAKLKLLREGEPQEISVKLERTRITPEEARRDRNRDFEINVREVTFFDRDENRWEENIQGVLVESVESAGWAALGGIRGGDLVQRIDNRDIKGLDDYRRILKELTAAQPERVVFVVLRGVRTHFQYVEPDWKPEADTKPATGDKKE
jgi:S1-C subfamily serine protease